jgi:hypothetical protein
MLDFNEVFDQIQLDANLKKCTKKVLKLFLDSQGISYINPDQVGKRNFNL